MDFWHGGDVGGVRRPRPEPVEREHAHGSTRTATHQHIFAGAVAGGGRAACQAAKDAVGLLVSDVSAQKALDAVQVLEYQLVAGIELDARLAVYTLGIELGAEPALWAVAVAARLA